jgi:hypothetical protein
MLQDVKNDHHHGSWPLSHAVNGAAASEHHWQIGEGLAAGSSSSSITQLT